MAVARRARQASAGFSLLNMQLLRESLVFGEYVPGPTTTGPLPGSIIQTLGTGPTWKGQSVYDIIADCPLEVPNAADWNDGTDYRYTVSAANYSATEGTYVVEGLRLYGSINLNGYSNVIVRNCEIWGDCSHSGATSPIFSNPGGENLNGLDVYNCRFPGRPRRRPDTYNGKAMLTKGYIDPANHVNNGMRGGNYRIRWCEFYRYPDGIGLTSQNGSVSIMGNWIHGSGYIEWPPIDAAVTYYTDEARTNLVTGNGYFPSAAGGSMYTHEDCIQFHRGRHYRICGNALGNYRGGACSGSFDHNADWTYVKPPTGSGSTIGTYYPSGEPSQRAQILACEDYYNSCFMITQEVSSSDADRVGDVIIWNNFLGGGVSTINFPSATKYSPPNPFDKRLAQDNYTDSSDDGIGVWHNRVRADNGSPLEFLIYPTYNDRFVDNLRTDGSSVKISRSS
jgi:hypothetical protein